MPTSKDHFKPFNLVFVEAQPEIAKMVSFSLESQFAVSVFEVSDVDSAIAFLKSASDIAAVIIGDAEKHSRVAQYILERPDDQSLQLIFCIDQKLKDPTLLTHAQVLGVARRKNLVPELSQLLREKLFPGDIVEAPAPTDFARISPPLLGLVPTLASDIYIRLGKSKYLKIFHAGDALSPAEIERYWTHKRIDYFFVRAGETAQLVRQFSAAVERMVHDQNVETAAIRATSLAIQDTIHETVSLFGVTEEVREMTQASMKLVVQSIGTQPRLSSIFNRINKEMGRYIVSHSLALGEVACVFAANMEWASDLTFNKLVLAALFHDITLKNHELAKVTSLSQAQTDPSLLVLDTLEDLKLHPLKAAALVNELHNVPADVDLIIRQHHERPDGSGFPQGIGQQNFSPLSSIFIIAHDFLDYSYERKAQATLAEFIDLRRDEYSGGYFRKILRALEIRGGTS